MNDFKKKGGQNIIEVVGTSDLEIENVSIDSRCVSPGTLFVALKGSMRDGHNYIEASIQQGATAILTARPLPKPIRHEDIPVTFIRVSDTQKALEHLGPYLYKDPAEQLKLIGITGTNGKTTTAYLIESLLLGASIKTGLLSTVAYRSEGRQTKPINTTPGLLDLHKCFSKIRRDGATHVVMEVSSHALHQGRVAGCRFETAVFTNLSQDHLDYHGTMADYFSEKQKLFHQTPGEWIVNSDDPWGEKLLRETPHKTLRYGIIQKKEIYPLQFRSTLDGIWMIARTPIGEIEISSHLVGRHNVYNVLAAIGVAITQGLSKEAISAGISSLKNVPGRFEKIDMGQDFTVVVDYAHTPDALERLLQAVSGFSPNQVITLFGCGGDRDRGKRPQMGKAAATYSQKVILTSDNPRSEPPLAIIKEIEAGLQSHNEGAREAMTDYEIIPDRCKAIRSAINTAKTGDIVVIAGKGHETDQEIRSRKIHFDDREMARYALSERN